MTDQHPLTDEICEELSSWHIDVLDPGLADDIRNDIRAGADCQLEQVIEFLKDNKDLSIKTALRFIRPVMRSKQQQQEDN